MSDRVELAIVLEDEGEGAPAGPRAAPRPSPSPRAEIAPEKAPAAAAPTAEPAEEKAARPAPRPRDHQEPARTPSLRESLFKTAANLMLEAAKRQSLAGGQLLGRIPLLGSLLEGGIKAALQRLELGRGKPGAPTPKPARPAPAPPPVVVRPAPSPVPAPSPAPVPAAPPPLPVPPAPPPVPAPAPSPAPPPPSPAPAAPGAPPAPSPAPTAPAAPQAPPAPPGAPPSPQSPAPPAPAPSPTGRPPVTPPAAPPAPAAPGAPTPPTPTPRAAPAAPTPAPAPAAAGGAGAAGAAAPAAAGGASALAGIAAVAGPVVVALAVVNEVGKAVAAGFNALRANVEVAGKTLGDLARNDYGAAFERTTEHVAKGLEMIPIVGQVWASQLRAASAVVTAFKDTVQSFVERGRELSGYNQQLATSTARADVTSLMADIKEANELGPDLARLTDAQTSFYNDFREIMLPIKKVIVGVLADIMEALGAFLNAARPFIDDMRERFNYVVQFLQGLAETIPGVAAAIKEIRDRIRKAIEDNKARQDKVDSSLFDNQMKDLAEAFSRPRAARGFDPVFDMGGLPPHVFTPREPL